jgi:hypothetical protein
LLLLQLLLRRSGQLLLQLLQALASQAQQHLLSALQPCVGV